MKGMKYKEAWGNIGIRNLITPYRPSLSNKPANITDPSIEASTWASGNHKCKGNIGILTEIAMKKNIQKNFWI